MKPIKKGEVAIGIISITCSSVATLLCGCYLVYKLINHQDNYTLWLVLLIVNILILFLNLSGRKKK